MAKMISLKMDNLAVLMFQLVYQNTKVLPQVMRYMMYNIETHTSVHYVLNYTLHFSVSIISPVSVWMKKIFSLSFSSHKNTLAEIFVDMMFTILLL